MSYPAGMATHDLRRLYVTKIMLPPRFWPPVSTAVSVQTEDPWRVGRGIAIRPLALVLTVLAILLVVSYRQDPRGWVIGWWGRTLDLVEDVPEEGRLLSAMRFVSRKMGTR